MPYRHCGMIAKSYMRVITCGSRRGCSTINSTVCTETHVSTSLPSTSSHQPDSFQAIVSAARRSRFVPPSNLDEDDCWVRMNDWVYVSKENPDSLRLGDLLILSNSLLKNNRLDCMEVTDLVNLVYWRIKDRSRFPSMLALIQYLRFVNLSSSKVSSLSAITLTLQLASVAKTSELVEVFELVLKTGALNHFSRFENTDFLTTLGDRLRAPDDSESFSESNRRNIVRLAVHIFGGDFKLVSLDRQARESVIKLISDLMADRNCAYPELLSGMITTGLDAFITDSESTLIARAIRDHQLSGWKFVEPLFVNDSSWNEKLSELGEKAKVDFSLPSSKPVMDSDSIFFGNEYGSHSSRGITGVYRRIFSDLNNAPRFQKGQLFLYFSPSSKCWQISSDPSNDLFRIAFVPGCPEVVPTRESGWLVFTRKTSTFVSTNYKLLTAEDIGATPLVRSVARKSSSRGLIDAELAEPVKENEESVSRECSQEILTAWERQCARPTERDEKLESLEKMIKQLEEKVRVLECVRGRGDSVGMENHVESPRSSVNSARDAYWSQLKRKISDFMTQETVKVDSSVKTFEQLRADELRKERLHGIAKLVARKLRN